MSLGHVTDVLSVRQHRATLDATGTLMRLQFRVHESIRSGRRPYGVDIIGLGLPAIRRALGRHTPKWSQSLYPDTSVEILQASLHYDLMKSRRGERMESVYNPDGFDSEAERFILEHPVLCGRTGPALLQMKVYDRRAVVLEGPELAGDRSAMLVTRSEVVWAALQLLRYVFPVAHPLPPQGQTGPSLTARQREVVAMLADGLGDDVIAKRMQISVRTVRSEVAVVLQAVGATSRFGAGYRLGRQLYRQ